MLPASPEMKTDRRSASSEVRTGSSSDDSNKNPCHFDVDNSYLSAQGLLAPEFFLRL